MARPESEEPGDLRGADPRVPRSLRWVTWHPLRTSAFLGLQVVETAMRVKLQRAVSARAYPFVVGLVGLILTVSMVPFASILIGAILLDRGRWREIVFLSSLGSATGGVVLYLTFHHLGWNQITAAYPDLMQSKAWADATRWVSAYGTWALFGIAATPLPQTPALVFTAVLRLPVLEVFAALLFGKLLKYSAYGFLAARFPDWFQSLVIRNKPDE
jgi:membrane protein YqaA with SNARE-associated domain